MNINWTNRSPLYFMESDNRLIRSCFSVLAEMAWDNVTAWNRVTVFGLDWVMISKSELITVPMVTKPPPKVRLFLHCLAR